MKRRLSSCLLFFLILIAAGVHAHGGGEIQLANAPVGPYLMTAWLNPPRPAADETLHVTVGLAAPPANTAVLDAQVQVTVNSMPAAAEILSTPATTAQSVNKLFYETDFELDAPGRYEVLLAVTGPEGSGTAAFPMELAPPRKDNWLVIGLTALGAVTLVSLYRNHTRSDDPAPRRRRRRSTV